MSLPKRSTLHVTVSRDTLHVFTRRSRHVRVWIRTISVPRRNSLFQSLRHICFYDIFWDCSYTAVTRLTLTFVLRFILLQTVTIYIQRTVISVFLDIGLSVHYVRACAYVQIKVNLITWYVYQRKWIISHVQIIVHSHIYLQTNVYVCACICVLFSLIPSICITNF